VELQQPPAETRTGRGGPAGPSGQACPGDAEHAARVVPGAWPL